MALPAESQPIEMEGITRIQQEEIFAIREAVMRADQLVTHKSPDLDALLSLALAQIYRRRQGMRIDLPVSFVSGNCRDFSQRTLALDIGDGNGLRSTASGGSMIKASAAGGSCCMAMARILPEKDFNLIRTFAEEISLADEGKEDKNTIERVFRKHRLWAHAEDKNALTSVCIFDLFNCLRNANAVEMEMYKFILLIIEGMLNRGYKTWVLKQKNPWDGAEIFFGSRFAVLPIGSGLYHAKALQQQGVEVTLHTTPIDRAENSWSMCAYRTSRAYFNFNELFKGKMEDFPGIFMNEYLMGWGVKGGGVKGTSKDIRLLRDRFVNRVKSILQEWYSSSH